MIRTINGETFKSMVMEAACAIEANKVHANELNVFPVPDGDTGTNMSMTMAASYYELEKLINPTVGKAAEITASALLRAARGNSGVITSLLFRGISKVLKGSVQCSAKTFADALSQGVKSAYQAVMKPAEGTILTVTRVTAQKAQELASESDDVVFVFEGALKAAKDALAETTMQNPVLERAKVVDSGGFGFVVMFEAMYNILCGKEPSKMTEADGTAGNSAAAGFENESIQFTYCTEFIASRDDKGRSINKLRDFLQNIGDSAVVVDDDEIIKVHVHTNKPDRVLSEALKFGALLSIKIENMKKQHTEIIMSSENDKDAKKSAVPEKKFGFVSVAAGEGLKSVFRDLGTDLVVSGGQTMNPSTEDILSAVEQTPAEVVFVLPNNKNIIMAAQQAEQLCLDKKIVVIPSATIPQGITAMLSFDQALSAEENKALMTGALSSVKTGQVTYAVRDSDFDGKKISSGDYLAIADGKLCSSGKNKDAVIKKMAKELLKNGASFITVIYGEGVTDNDAAHVSEILQTEAKEAEVNVINGGQPVYYYIISAE